jgi:hypothetical protein
MIPGKFTFLCENYREELTFELVPGGVRNRAGANEQFCGAVKYNSTIFRQDGALIHVENGMYLYMDQMYNHPADDESIQTDIGFPELSAGAGANGPVFVPGYTIARSGTIPHGSTITLFGKYSHKLGKPFFPQGAKAWDFEHLALSETMGGAGTTRDNPINLDQPPPDWVTDRSLPFRCPSGNQTYTQRILAHPLYPYSVRPDLRLRDLIKGQTIEKYDLIELDTFSETGPRGGVLNTPIISRYAPVTRVRSRMWIEIVVENGEEVLQVQYEQISNLEFGFGTDGGTTRWPHIQVNTLRKKK